MLKQGTRVLVTGGAGFIGAHLVRALVAAGGQVRVLDDLSSGRRERLRGLFGPLELMQTDVRNLAAVERAAAGAHAIVHLAGAPTLSDLQRAEEVMLGGALNILQVVRQMDKRDRPRVIFCGAGAVYGRQSAFVLHEELTPRPSTPAAVLALAVEQFGRVFHHNYGVPVVNLRVFRVFGPEEELDRIDAGVVARFAHAALDGVSPIILGDGQQTRDLVYVDNVVAAIECAMRAEANAEPLNVASGEAVTINFLWRLVLEVAGKRRLAIDPTHVPPPAGDPEHARPQIARACKVLGWSPTVRLREGLTRTLNHHLGMRDADPNAWFTPREGPRRPTAPPCTPPPAPLARRPAGDEQEITDADLVDEIEVARAAPWAPVPPPPGLSR
jgi:UDP-glucose 4-epimerase